MKRTKRLFTLIIGLIFLMIPMTALAAERVTPNGHGYASTPYQLNDLGIGEYEFSTRSGDKIYLEITTKVAATVYIKEDPNQTKKNVGANNSYYAQLSYQSSSTTCTVVVEAHKHQWKAASGTCVICNKKCKHPKTTIVKYQQDGDYHIIHRKCKTCGYVLEEKVKHSWSIAETGDGNQHLVRCNKCKATKYGKCKFTKVINCKPKTDFAKKSIYHRTIYKCSCGYKKGVDEVHTYKNNVCTKCGFKRAVPGAMTGLKVVQKDSPKKKSYTFEGHWGVTGKWVSAKTVTYYVCNVNFSFAAPKNGYKYEIEYTPFVSSIVSGGKTLKTVTTTSNDLYLILPKAATEVTFKVTPISKTGTRGKTQTITKTIK